VKSGEFIVLALHFQTAVRLLDGDSSRDRDSQFALRALNVQRLTD
jgi:hypothetical protein